MNPYDAHRRNHNSTVTSVRLSVEQRALIERAIVRAMKSNASRELGEPRVRWSDRPAVSSYLVIYALREARRILEARSTQCDACKHDKRKHGKKGCKALTVTNGGMRPCRCQGFAQQAELPL